MMQMTNIIGIRVGVAVVAGLLLAHGEDGERRERMPTAAEAAAAAVVPLSKLPFPASLRKKKRILPESRC